MFRVWGLGHKRNQPRHAQMPELALPSAQLSAFFPWFEHGGLALRLHVPALCGLQQPLSSLM